MKKNLNFFVWYHKAYLICLLSCERFVEKTNLLYNGIFTCMFSLQSSVSSFIFHNFDRSFTLNPAFLSQFADFYFVVWYPKPPPFCFFKQCCNAPAIFLGPTDQNSLHKAKISFDDNFIIKLWFKFKDLIFDIIFFICISSIFFV